MLRCLLPLAAILGFRLAAVQAQGLSVRSPLPGYGAERPGLPLPALPGGAAPTLAAAAPIPTVGAAATYLPLAALAHRFAQPLLAAAPPQAPRRDLTGIGASPAYDPYQNWPEAQRKYLLPAVWAEPLPLQVLKNVLSR